MDIQPQNSQNALSDAQRLQERTLKSVISEFLRAKKSSETRKAYKMDIYSFFDAINVSTVGDLIQIPIYELSNKIIDYTESFKKSEQYREDRIANPRTVNRKAYAISSFFEFLTGHYGYPRNPAKVYTPYATPSRTSTHDLEEDELQAFWKYVQTIAAEQKDIYSQSPAKKSPMRMISSCQQMLIVAFLMLSLRRNEVANLKRDDWDTAQQTITIFGKGQKYKYLPVPKKMTTYLKAYQTMKQEHGYTSEYMFSPVRNNRTNDHDKPITGTYIYNLVKKITKHLQQTQAIDPKKTITPHSFRTTFVKIALENKKTDIEIMNATGHSTAQMVKYYDARSPLDVNAANSMDDIF